ncbi:hypothetical protein HDU93_004077, partial [Gonapodya sp. JEL0774]
EMFNFRPILKSAQELYTSSDIAGTGTGAPLPFQQVHAAEIRARGAPVRTGADLVVALSPFQWSTIRPSTDHKEHDVRASANKLGTSSLASKGNSPSSVAGAVTEAATRLLHGFDDFESAEDDYHQLEGLDVDDGDGTESNAKRDVVKRTTSEASVSLTAGPPSVSHAFGSVVRSLNTPARPDQDRGAKKGSGRPKRPHSVDSNQDDDHFDVDSGQETRSPTTPQMQTGQRTPTKRVRSDTTEKPAQLPSPLENDPSNRRSTRATTKTSAVPQTPKATSEDVNAKVTYVAKKSRSSGGAGRSDLGPSKALTEVVVVEADQLRRVPKEFPAKFHQTLPCKMRLLRRVLWIHRLQLGNCRKTSST